MTDEARFLKKKKFGGPNLGLTGLNQVQNEIFGLLELRSYVFLEIANNDSLRQCVRSRIGKTYEKKLGPKVRFFAIFSI